MNIALIIVACIGLFAVGWAVGRFLTKNPTSAKEQALKALDKAAKVVANLSDPGPEEQVAIAARVKREELLQQSIAASVAKINPASSAPPAAS